MTTVQTLLFLRHAQTDLAGTFCGSSNPPLNETGMAQLAPMLDRLNPYAIHLVYASDLLRALQTAESIARARSIPLLTTPALREIGFGDWETLDWATIEQRDKPFAERWVREFPHLATPNGEPMSQFRSRVLAELTRLRADAHTHSRNVAIVTHAGVLRCLLEALGHLSPHQAWERTRDYTCVIPCTQDSPTGPLEVHL